MIIQFGRGRQSWGAGNNIELPISEESNSYDYGMLDLDFGKLKVRYFHGYLETDSNFVNRYITGRGIEWNNNKNYYRHTGHPGGIKTTTPSKLMKNKPEEILKLAVKRMLPRGPLAKKQLTKLKIYNGEKHPHDVQKPQIIEFGKLNKKNLIRN